MRINFIFDKTKKSLNFKKKILKFFKNYPAKKADYFVVAGGDGFMLKIIKKYMPVSRFASPSQQIELLTAANTSSQYIIGAKYPETELGSPLYP